jgi:hypothetical protein
MNATHIRRRGGVLCISGLVLFITAVFVRRFPDIVASLHDHRPSDSPVRPSAICEASMAGLGTLYELLSACPFTMPFLGAARLQKYRSAS